MSIQGIKINRATRDVIVRLGLKLENNHVTMKGKKAIIETEPDMDSGWITEEEPEDE